MRILTGSITLLLLLAIPLTSSASDPMFGSTPAAGTTAAAAVLTRPDVYLARSVISATAFRGSLGENVVSKAILEDYLHQTGNWQSITPRSGPQGFDHLSIKTNSRGIPIELEVGETKFNQSTLGITRDGIQMGKRWINKRLSALGSRYLSVAGKSTFPIARMPLLPKQQISVVLKNGRQVHFWRSSSLDQWKFSGRSDQLAEAKRLAEAYGSFLKKAGDGIITYRSRIFNVIPRGNNLEIIVYDAKNIDRLQSMAKLKQLTTIKLPGILSNRGTLNQGARTDIARALKTRLNLDDSGARHMAKEITERYTPGELMQPISLKKYLLTTMINSGMVAITAMGADTILQFVTANHVDPVPMAISSGSAAVGYFAYPWISIGLRTPAAARMIQNISAPLNCSSNMMTITVSSFASGTITTALFSYGLYFMGYSDLKTANRNMLIGTVANGAGALFVTGTMMAVATWGTAGTGSAIAGLSGAAATNASLAWLGGGSIAVGGGGMALGSAVLTGGTIIVIAAVAYGGYKLFQLKDESDESNRIRTLIKLYSDPENMDKIVGNSPYVRELRQK